mgnify:CR=1 FL=1
MIHRSSPVKLLVFSALVSLVALVAIRKDSTRTVYEYVPDRTQTFHPPATVARQEASEVLSQWDDEARERGTAIFTPEVPAGQPLGLGVRLSHTRFGSDVDVVHAAVAVRAVQREVEGATPLRIALVVDRSGSMDGEKFDHAIVAGHRLIDALSERDSLAIVTYGSHADVAHELRAITPSSRREMHDALDRIRLDGATNLSGGYEAALQLLQPASPDAINRIILLSDGQANEGIVDPDALAQMARTGLGGGVSLSTMGVGLDYDEVLMQALAQNGAGNYYFIERASDTDRLLQDEFKGLVSTVARNTELRFRLPQGAQIQAIDGFTYRRDGDEYVVNLAAFFAGQQKDLLLDIEVGDSLHGEVELLQARLVYDADDSRREMRVARVVTIGPGPIVADEIVLRRVQQIRTARAFIVAMDTYDAGDRFEAAEIIRAQRAENRKFLDDLDLDDPGFERVDEKMEQLADDLETTRRQSTKGKWMRKVHYKYANEAVQSSVKF